MNFLAIDLGLKRIGLAYSAEGTIVTPLRAIERRNRYQAASEVRTVIEAWHIEAVIIGIPMGGSSEAEMRRRVAHFMNLVAFEGPVYHQDESESSIEAQELMCGIMKQKRDGRIDSLAAKIILDRWLNTRT